MRLPRATLIVAALALLTAGLLSGCGSSGGKDPSSASSGSAARLLDQTFSQHALTSGDLQVSLQIVPSGSSELTSPITISFAGPFQSEGAGKAPESDFTISGTLQGHTGSLQLISAGGKAYVTLEGTSYQLPAGSFSKLASSLTSSSTAHGSNVLSQLGIRPLQWLTNPRVVGQQQLGGVQSTHISAGVNVPALVRSLSRLITHAKSLGVPDASKVPSGISAAQQSQIVAHIKSPAVNIWTGSSDKTLRKLTVGLTVPLGADVSKELGGLSSVKLMLTVAYSDINQPQTITAPASTEPYSQFEEKVAAVLEAIESGVAGGGLSGATNTSTTATTTPATNSVDGRYSQCITKAAGNVAKMQRCSKLLSSNG
ncbi:MAG TPA: hypothetical protein VME01_09255 [Solirubrobacteraceae bacterium]|nr:hypothetical protein [Solirubrobacteraceae bacterium]